MALTVNEMNELITCILCWRLEVRYDLLAVYSFTQLVNFLLEPDVIGTQFTTWSLDGFGSALGVPACDSVQQIRLKVGGICRGSRNKPSQVQVKTLQ